MCASNLNTVCVCAADDNMRAAVTTPKMLLCAKHQYALLSESLTC